MAHWQLAKLHAVSNFRPLTSFPVVTIGLTGQMSLPLLSRRWPCRHFFHCSQRKRVGQVHNALVSLEAPAEREQGGKGSGEYGGSLRRLLPLAVMYSAACFTNSIMETLKDTIVVTSCGAEALPFLSTFVALPGSLLALAGHSWLRRRFSPSHVFHATLAPFLTFYLLFALLLYPHHLLLHAGAGALLGAPRLSAMMPQGLRPLLDIICNWTFSLFFAAADLWGPVAISLLFFSSAHEVLSYHEAESVFPLLGVVANVAVILSGLFTSRVLNCVSSHDPGHALVLLVGSCCVAAGTMSASRAFLDWDARRRRMRRDAVVAALERELQRSASGLGKGDARGKVERRGGKKGSWEVVMHSSTVRSVFVLVASYGLCYKLFEVAWKQQLGALCPSPAEYQGVMSVLQTAVGSCTLCLMLAGRFIFRRLGWGAAAAATPLLMLATGGAFFVLALMGRGVDGGVAVAHKAELMQMGVAVGAVAEVASRSTRHSLLEPAKEMKYLHMTPQERDEGKPSVDLMASQVGKSGASWLIQCLLLLLGSVQACLPVIAALFLVVIVAWLASIRNLASLDGTAVVEMVPV